MKIVVIGGTGLIGSKVVQRLVALGHEALAASPGTGVDTLTGEGLAEALAGAAVVVDVSNSPSFDADAAMAFFTTAGRNIRAAEVAAGVGHHVALSVVGSERLTAMGYFSAKLAQERMIAEGPVPWSLLRATQFFPFIGAIVQAATVDGAARLSPARFQPVSPDDVAEALVEMALGAPINRMVEIAGPEAMGLDAFAARFLEGRGDATPVVTDPAATYFGVALDDRSLTPGPDARIGPTRLADWLRATSPAGVS